MHVRQKRIRSGSVSVVVVDKAGGRYREVHTVGIAREEWEIEELVKEGREWIRLHKLERQPELGLHGEERRALESGIRRARRRLWST